MDQDRQPAGRQAPMTKRELKAMRRLEKLDREKETSRQNTIKWIVLGVGALAFLAFFGFLVFLAKQNSASKEIVKFQDNGWIRGDKMASVTLVEFADFQCPACKAYYPIVKELGKSYEGKLKLVYKHFPLTSIHKNAMLAAMSAEAAGAQGKFFEMHDLIYEHQGEWSEKPNQEAQEMFIGFARQLGLDETKFTADLKNPKFEDKIRAHQNEGIDNGVNATPTFFVNGRKIQSPQGIEEFKKIIDGELR